MIFVHLHKTGGQFINRLLLKHVPGSKRIGYHLPRSEAPISFQSLPALGFVRNPWDWYVSWYAFNQAVPQRNPIFRVVSSCGKLDFDATIENLIRLGDEDHKNMREQIAAQLPETRHNNLGSGITRQVMLNMHEQGYGYVTWIWRYMFVLNGTINDMTIGRSETLRRDLVECLEKLNIAISPAMHSDIATGEVINASEHDNYRRYYADRLRLLIAEREQEYIEYNHYSF